MMYSGLNGLLIFLHESRAGERIQNIMQKKVKSSISYLFFLLHPSPLNLHLLRSTTLMVFTTLQCIQILTLGRTEHGRLFKSPAVSPLFNEFSAGTERQSELGQNKCVYKGLEYKWSPYAKNQTAQAAEYSSHSKLLTANGITEIVWHYNHIQPYSKGITFLASPLNRNVYVDQKVDPDFGSNLELQVNRIKTLKQTPCC